MPAPFTYSFLSVHASLVGPGAGFSIGSGSGASEEGITITPNAEMDSMTIGADGSPMHSLVANKAGRVTIRLLKTSPTNALLSAAQALQKAAPANHGQNTLTITNVDSGDVITCQQVAFAKDPDLTYAKEGGIVEWEFNAGIIDRGLGAGVPAA